MITIFLVAMDYEIENIFDLKDFKIEENKPYKIFRHIIKNNIYIVKTGIGKVNAAAATQFIISKFNLKEIINLGLVGSLNTKIKIGDVKEISECRFFDVNVTEFGYALGQIPQCEVINYELKTENNEFIKIISGDTFITDHTILKDILNVFPADFIDMELGAIAHTLYINDKLNFLRSYKSVSDYANSNSKESFYENEKLAFKNLKTIVNNLINYN